MDFNKNVYCSNETMDDMRHKISDFFLINLADINHHDSDVVSTESQHGWTGQLATRCVVPRVPRTATLCALYAFILWGKMHNLQPFFKFPTNNQSYMLCILNLRIINSQSLESCLSIQFSQPSNIKARVWFSKSYIIDVLTIWSIPFFGLSPSISSFVIPLTFSPTTPNGGQ